MGLGSVLQNCLYACANFLAFSSASIDAYHVLFMVQWYTIVPLHFLVSCSATSFHSLAAYILIFSIPVNLFLLSLPCSAGLCLFSWFLIFVDIIPDTAQSLHHLLVRVCLYSLVFLLLWFCGVGNGNLKLKAGG